MDVPVLRHLREVGYDDIPAVVGLPRPWSAPWTITPLSEGTSPRLSQHTNGRAGAVRLSQIYECHSEPCPVGLTRRMAAASQLAAS